MAGNSLAHGAFRVSSTEVTSMARYVLATAVLVAFAGPALAQEFFIVRGPDKKCQIVEKRPTEKTIVVIGDKAYVTREEAEKQLKVICKDN
jgi:hypothetical protein